MKTLRINTITTDTEMCEVLPQHWISKLKDLVFADDIALLDVSLNGIQDLTSQVEDAAKLVGLRVNAEKTKIMILGTLPHGNITVSGSTVETVNEFCYLGSIIQDDSSCDKNIRARLGKANGVFGRLTNIWKDNGLSTLHTKIRLYEALVLSTLLYGAETWSMSVSNTKKLEAAHHRWQRKILKISWKDMITNKTVRERTGQS